MTYAHMTITPTHNVKNMAVVDNDKVKEKDIKITIQNGAIPTSYEKTKAINTYVENGKTAFVYQVSDVIVDTKHFVGVLAHSENSKFNIVG